MKPDRGFLKSGVPAKLQANALMEAGKKYAAYFVDPSNATPQSLSLTLLLPAVDFHVEWVDVLSSKPTKRERLKSSGSTTITVPEFQREFALSIRR